MNTIDNLYKAAKHYLSFESESHYEFAAREDLKQALTAYEQEQSIGHTPESEMQELSKDELIERLIYYQRKAERYEYKSEYTEGIIQAARELLKSCNNTEHCNKAHTDPDLFKNQRILAVALSTYEQEQSKPEQTEGNNTNNSDFKSGEDVYTWLRMHGAMRIPFDAVDKRVIVETIDLFASQQTASLIKQIEEKDKRIEELEMCLSIKNSKLFKH